MPEFPGSNTAKTDKIRPKHGKMNQIAPAQSATNRQNARKRSSPPFSPHTASADRAEYRRAATNAHCRPHGKPTTHHRIQTNRRETHPQRRTLHQRRNRRAVPITNFVYKPPGQPRQTRRIPKPIQDKNYEYSANRERNPSSGHLKTGLQADFSPKMPEFSGSNTAKTDKIRPKHCKIGPNHPGPAGLRPVKCPATAPPRPGNQEPGQPCLPSSPRTANAIRAGRRGRKSTTSRPNHRG